MKKIIILLTIFFLLTNCTPKQTQNQVCFENNCYKVELAQTKQEQAKGLMYIEHLDQDAGMLFIFNKQSPHYFWMKNTKIPLDIIWINEKNQVIYINKNTPPCKQDPCPTYGIDTPVKFVLEINAGEADKIGLKKGDDIEIYFQDN